MGAALISWIINELEMVVAKKLSLGCFCLAQAGIRLKTLVLHSSPKLILFQHMSEKFCKVQVNHNATQKLKGQHYCIFYLRHNNQVVNMTKRVYIQERSPDSWNVPVEHSSKFWCKTCHQNQLNLARWFTKDLALNVMEQNVQEFDYFG